MRTERALRAMAPVLFVLVGLLSSSTARAYPFMISHGYTGCGECHIDPSGGGVLREYGRGQAEILLRTPWEPRDADWSPGAVKDFLFGAVRLPERVQLQADSRTLVVPQPGSFRVVQMQTDLRGAFELGKVVGSGSFGWVSVGAQAAQVTRNPAGANLVSRQYWVGYAPSKETMLRIGRMNLPFGIRDENHLLYTRAVTRTDTNAQQQFGASFAWSRGRFRSEVMGIVGNLQLKPAQFWDHGAVGSIDWSPSEQADIGLSALYTNAALDPYTLRPLAREAFGLYTRVVPRKRFVFMGEVDGLGFLADRTTVTRGLATALQLDWEAVQGVHLRGAEQICDTDFSDGAAAVQMSSLTALWFFAPHADLRLDAMKGSLACDASSPSTWMGLAQVHFFL